MILSITRMLQKNVYQIRLYIFLDLKITASKDFLIILGAANLTFFSGDFSCQPFSSHIYAFFIVSGNFLEFGVYLKHGEKVFILRLIGLQLRRCFIKMSFERFEYLII